MFCEHTCWHHKIIQIGCVRIAIHSAMYHDTMPPTFFLALQLLFDCHLLFLLDWYTKISLYGTWFLLQLRISVSPKLIDKFFILSFVLAIISYLVFDLGRNNIAFFCMVDNMNLRNSYYHLDGRIFFQLNELTHADHLVGFFPSLIRVLSWVNQF